MDKVLHNVNVFDRYTKEYMDKFMEVTLYKDTFAYLLEKLPPGAAVLELGCGPGNIVKYLSTQRPDLKFLGIDLAPQMIRAAKKQNPGAAFRRLDIRHAGQIKGPFSAVLAPFCIPYLSYHDLVRLFTDLGHLVAEGGLVYLSCMEGAKGKQGFEKTSFTAGSELYISYYRREDMERLLQEKGFEIKGFYTKDYPETDGSITVDLFYIAKKR